MSTEPLLQNHDYEGSLYNRKLQGRSSLDTFIIPNRTRLPSSKPKVPEEFDIHLTQKLLDIEKMQKSIDPNPRTSSQRALVPVAKTSPVPDASLARQRVSSGTYSWSPAGYDGPIDSTDQSRGTSTTWSTVSARIFTDTSTGSDHRETSEFVKEYNNLATKYGLPVFVAQPKVESRVSSGQSSKSSAKSSIVVAPKPHWLLRKILRKSSSSYSVKTKAKATKPVCKSVSIADLRKIGRVDLLKDKSLEELARLGGVSLLMLPTDFAAAQLAVPVGICATAAYLLQHGRNMPGIFRISGQLSTVNKLYDYYAQQIEAADKGPTAIRQTVHAALVPSHISHNAHDVAAVFKKFLNALPGGILGSLSLFTALESIHKQLYANPDATESHRREARARLIALAISSVTSQYRVSLICAVLGLVAVIGHETQAALTSNGANFDSDSAPTAELMSYKGLGLVFAPLVIGDLTDEIELQPQSERGGVLSLPDSPPKRRRDSKRKTSMPKFPGMSTFLDMSGARYKIVANVFEMLLVHWTDIVPQLRSFGAMRGQSTSPGAPPQPAPPTSRPRPRQPSITHTRKTSAPAIAAAHGFAIFLGGAGAPPTSTTTATTTWAAPSSPRGARAGSVKQIVRHISRSTEPSASSGSGSSRGSDETRPRREALMAGLARQGSVKEAAQRLAAAAAAAAPSALPLPRPATATAASKGSLIPKPVAVASARARPSSPTMGELLAEARREAQMWRERAEWAERRLGFRMGAAGGVVPA